MKTGNVSQLLKCPGPLISPTTHSRPMKVLSPPQPPHLPPLLASFPLITFATNPRHKELLTLRVSYFQPVFVIIYSIVSLLTSIYKSQSCESLCLFMANNFLLLLWRGSFLRMFQVKYVYLLFIRSAGLKRLIKEVSINKCMMVIMPLVDIFQLNTRFPVTLWM